MKPSAPNRWALAIYPVVAMALFAAPCITARASTWPADRPAGGFAIDPQDRFLARSFYNVVYRASEGTPIEWTGDVGTCAPGTTSTSFKEAVRARVNYFRAMAGVPASIALRSEFNVAAQQAALIMSANNSINHHPPDSWSCWTGVGADAAASSNLSLGRTGWDAVNGQMRDNGANNAAVGHRRWILFPPIAEMGTGDIPSGSAQSATNALWINDGRLFDPRPPTREEFVAWPPPGYVPYSIVPARWSFSYPGADFGAATVIMSQAGLPVAVTQETVTPPPGSSSFIGDNTLVWVPAGLDADASSTNWPRPTDDMAYQVTIEDVVIGGQPRSFHYTVTIIDPLQRAPDEARPLVSGPAQAQTLASTAYAIAPVPHAIGYALRTLEPEAYVGIEGAEDGYSGILDGTDPSYPLISSAIHANGSHAFHLAHTNESPPPDQTITLAEQFLIGAAASLRFKTRLSWATSDQIALAEVSVDDGNTWIDLYRQSGAGGQGETGFSQRSVSLADYADQVVMVRFRYAVLAEGNYSWYPTTDEGVVGLYVDDIELVDVMRVTDDHITDLGLDTSFDFSPEAPGHYVLQARASLWQGYPPLEWGPATPVTAVDYGDLDTDGDGEPNLTDTDDDDDGLPDSWEIGYGLDPLDASDAALDGDQDGLTNRDEHEAGTDPGNADTDGDRHPDGADADPLDRMNPIPLEALPSSGGWRAILRDR